MKIYENAIGEYDDKIKKIFDTQMDRTLQVQEEMEEKENKREKENYGDKFVAPFQAKIHETYGAEQPKYTEFEQLNGRLKQEDLTAEELADIVRDLRAKGWVTINDEIANDQQRVQETTDAAFIAYARSVAQELIGIEGQSLQDIENERSILNNQLDNTTDPKTISEINDKLQSLENQEKGIRDYGNSFLEVFSPNIKEMTGGLYYLGSELKAFNPLQPVTIIPPVTKNSSAATTSKEPGHASGTDYFIGGMTRINENGDELIELPTGSKIYPHQERGRQLEKISRGGEVNN